jgi:hypothetical protein
MADFESVVREYIRENSGRACWCAEGAAMPRFAANLSMLYLELEFSIGHGCEGRLSEG